MTASSLSTKLEITTPNPALAQLYYWFQVPLAESTSGAP